MVHIGAGDLRTRIQVFAPPEGGGLNANGYPAGQPVNVFGEGKLLHCKWVNAHGSEIYDAKQAGVEEPATLTLRYTPKVTPACLIYREKDPAPYEVISVNNILDRRVWLEVRVQRKAAAK